MRKGDFKVDNNIPTRLNDFLEDKGFCKGGAMHRFDQHDNHFSDVLEEFFAPLVEKGEILFWNYNEEEIYEDICGTFASIAFAWVTSDNPKSIDMFTFVVEE